ncbi:MAG: hypothetical protein R3F54_10280 [Alphaproteobacteria bacterium]
MLERAILENAWSIIDDAGSWTQSASARDQQGAKVQPDDSDACCWCAIGAIEKAVTDMDADETLVIEIVEHLCASAKALFGTRSINYVNDHMDHDAVRRLFDHAIADYRLVEAAGIDEEPAETERLRAAIDVCLGYINQLEDSLRKKGAAATELDPVINHIKHSMRLPRLAN